MSVGLYLATTGAGVTTVKNVLLVLPAFLAVLAQNELGKLAGAQLFAHTGRAVENVGMGDAIAPDGLLELVASCVLGNY